MKHEYSVRNGRLELREPPRDEVGRETVPEGAATVAGPVGGPGVEPAVEPAAEPAAGAEMAATDAVHLPPAPFVCYVNPDYAEKQELVDMGIDEHDISCAIDPDELGRVEFGEDHAVIIMKTPRNYSDKDNYLFKVTTFGLFCFKDRLVMVAPFDESELFQLKPVTKARSQGELILRVVSSTVAHFFGHLRVINMISDSLEQKVNTSMENKHLLGMFSIGKSLIFILNGIASNAATLERLKAGAAKIGFTEDERDLLDDICIENNQCNRQAEIYADILTDLTDARGNIVSNNLNILIKRLTIISVVFMPLNVIAGIGGMSEFSSWTKSVPFWIAYPALAAGMAGIAQLTLWVIKRMNPEGGGSERASRKGRR